jgi:hypothetical protein
MKATLSSSWKLSTEHAASCHGQPVLVNRRTGEAFGPGDVVTLSPSHGDTLATDGVRRLAKTAHLTVKGRALVARFVGSLAPEE